MNLGKQYSRFYEAIAANMVNESADIKKSLFAEFGQLWVHPKVSLVFAAIFYREVLLYHDPGVDDSQRRSKHVSVCLAGMRHLLWSDLHSSSRRFRGMYIFLRDEVVFSTSISVDGHVGAISDRLQVECARLVAMFSLFYSSAEEVAEIISCFPNHGRDNRFGSANILDLFVRETLRAMAKVRAAEELTQIMAGLVDLNSRVPFGDYLTLGTTLRLQELLYLLSQPGGPHYPPTVVRHAAAVTYDQLYPGRYLRALFKMLTSILHPLYGAKAALRNTYRVVARSVEAIAHWLSGWPW